MRGRGRSVLAFSQLRLKVGDGFARGPGLRTKLGADEVKIEIVTSDDMMDKAIDAIRRAAQTGSIGDGKIFVSNIEEAIRIRTGESGTDAI